MNDQLKRIEWLRAAIIKHNALYHNLNKPEITDGEYDLLCQELTLLEQGLFVPNSPVAVVAGVVDSKFTKIKHIRPMSSLNNAFTQEEVAHFYNKIYNIYPEAEFVCEPKIDGLSFSAIYDCGELRYAVTRGDGEFGEDITANLKHVIGMPLSVPYLNEFEVRGEVYMSKSEFLALNKKQHAKSADAFANPRNAAAGTLRNLDSTIIKERNLQYFVWGGFLQGCELQSSLLLQMQNFGFCVNDKVKICHSIDDIIAYYEEMYALRAELPYDIDGLVYKLNNFTFQDKLGATNKAPRWAVAHKFPAEVAITRIEDITIQVGRTGVLTPIGMLKPVNIGGVLVSRATLHNQDEIKRKDIRIGDIVKIRRAGDVIPQVIEVEYNRRNGTELTFSFPNQCPVCFAAVEHIPNEVAVRCSGGYECASQMVEYINHFVSRGAFNIVGFGATQVEKFYQDEVIRSVVDIMKLTELDALQIKKLEEKSGWGVKSVANLIAAINQSKNIALHKFIYALGIRHVGEVNAEIIAKHFITFDAFYQAIKNKDWATLDRIDGIGPTILRSVKSFFDKETNQKIIEDLLRYVFVKDYLITDIIPETPFHNQRMIFSGKLNSTSREEAEAIAKRMGAKIVSSISKKTDILVVGSDAGSKLEKAKLFGVRVMFEEEWVQHLKKSE